MGGEADALGGEAERTPRRKYELLGRMGNVLSMTVTD